MGSEELRLTELPRWWRAIGDVHFTFDVVQDSIEVTNGFGKGVSLSPIYIPQIIRILQAIQAKREEPTP